MKAERGRDCGEAVVTLGERRKGQAPTTEGRAVSAVDPVAPTALRKNDPTAGQHHRRVGTNNKQRRDSNDEDDDDSHSFDESMEHLIRSGRNGPTLLGTEAEQVPAPNYAALLGRSATVPVSNYSPPAAPLRSNHSFSSESCEVAARMDHTAPPLGSRNAAVAVTAATNPVTAAVPLGSCRWGSANAKVAATSTPLMYQGNPPCAVASAAPSNGNPLSGSSAVIDPGGRSHIGTIVTGSGTLQHSSTSDATTGHAVTPGFAPQHHATITYHPNPGFPSVKYNNNVGPAIDPHASAYIPAAQGAVPNQSHYLNTPPPPVPAQRADGGPERSELLDAVSALLSVSAAPSVSPGVAPGISPARRVGSFLQNDHVGEDEGDDDTSHRRIAIVFRHGRKVYYQKDRGVPADLTPRDVSVKYVIGSDIPKLQEGHLYSRQELREMGAHGYVSEMRESYSPLRRRRKGFECDFLTPFFIFSSTQKATSGRGAWGCDAIILAGKCPGKDDLLTFDYTVNNRDGGAAICRNIKHNLPMRVFRSSDPDAGMYRATPFNKGSRLNRYDGLYRAAYVKYRQENETEWTRVTKSRLGEPVHGRIYQFTLTRVPTGENAFLNKIEKEKFEEHCIAMGTMNPDTFRKEVEKVKSKQAVLKKGMPTELRAEVDVADTRGVDTCGVCCKDYDYDNLVQCDKCDHWYHIQCLDPPLKKIPKGEWFCCKSNEMEQRTCAHWCFLTGLLSPLSAAVECKPNIRDGLDELVDALPREIRRRFGECCWVHGGPGFGWWPCMIQDPRLTSGSTRSRARKALGKKFLILFMKCDPPYQLETSTKIVSWAKGMRRKFDQGETAKAAGDERFARFQEALKGKGNKWIAYR